MPTPCHKPSTVQSLENLLHDRYVTFLDKYTASLKDRMGTTEKLSSAMDLVKESISMNVRNGTIRTVEPSTSTEGTVRCEANVDIKIRDFRIGIPVKYNVNDDTISLSKNLFPSDPEQFPNLSSFNSLFDTSVESKQPSTDTDTISFENFRVRSQTPHNVEFTVDYDFHGESDNAYFQVIPMKGNKKLWEGFESDGAQLTPPGGTIDGELTYRTLNPQWNGSNPAKTVATDKLQLRVYLDGPDRVSKTIDLEKNWTIHQIYKPSDTIPDDPDVNDITVTSVERVDSTSYRVHYDYTYLSDHGPRVRLGVHALNPTKGISSCCTYIENLKRGDHSGSTQFSRELPNIKENPVTTKLQLSFQIGMTGKTIYEKTIDHRINWSQGFSSEDYIKTSISDKNLKNLLDDIRSYENLMNIPEERLTRFLNKAGTTANRSAYTKLLDYYLDENRYEVASTQSLYTESLRILLHAERSLPSSQTDRWLKESFRRLFREDNQYQPLYDSPFNERTFKKMLRLTRNNVIDLSLTKLNIPNVLIHHPDHPTLQIPDQSYNRFSSGINVFIRLPESQYLETIRVNRLIPETLTSDRYNTLFLERFGDFNQTHYRTYTSGSWSVPYSYNTFSTEDFWIPVQEDNIEWLTLTLPQLGVPGASYRLDLTSFRSPGDTIDPLNSGAIERKFDRYPSELKNWAETVEKAYAADSYANKTPPQPLSDTPSKEYRILTGAFHLYSGNFKRAKHWLQPIKSFDGPYTRKWAQMYRLLPLDYLSWQQFLSYRSMSTDERINQLTPLDLTVLGKYELARLYWQTGQYSHARRTFRSVATSLEPGAVLWDESRLYTISALFHEGKRLRALEELRTYLYRTHQLRSGGHKPFFFQVEGTFTNGLPMRNYLIHWLKAMRNGKRSWWYEQIGEAKEPIRYYRYFATTFQHEPVGRLVTDAYLNVTETQRAYMNHKGLRGGIPEGSITRNELFMVLPWNNRMHNFLLEPPAKISHRAIRKALESVPTPPNPVQGRGPGSNYYSGRYDVERYLHSVLDQGDPPEGIPVVTMPEFLTRMVDRLSDHYLARWTFTVEPQTGREMVGTYLRKVSPVESPIGNPSKKIRLNSNFDETNSQSKDTSNDSPFFPGIFNYFEW